MLFYESVAGHVMREGKLKYIGPVRNRKEAEFVAGKGIESGASTVPQLYDLAQDVGERNDLAAKRPADVARLGALLREVVSRNRAAGVR